MFSYVQTPSVHGGRDAQVEKHRDEDSSGGDLPSKHAAIRAWCLDVVDQNALQRNSGQELAFVDDADEENSFEEV